MAVTVMNSWSHSYNRDPDLGIKNSLKAAIQVKVQSIGARLACAWMNDCDLHCTENLCVCQLHIRRTSCMWIYSSVEDCKTTNVHNYHGAKVSNVRLQTTHRQLHTNNEHMLGHSKQQSRSQTPLKGGLGMRLTKQVPCHLLKEEGKNVNCTLVGVIGCMNTLHPNTTATSSARSSRQVKHSQELRKYRLLQLPSFWDVMFTKLMIFISCFDLSSGSKFGTWLSVKSWHGLTSLNIHIGRISFAFLPS